MKNLTILHDLSIYLKNSNNIESNSQIIDYCHDYINGEILFLSENGRIHCFSLINSELLGKYIDLDSCIETSDNDWFCMTMIAETAQIICISHTGNIISICENPIKTSSTDSMSSRVVEYQGTIDCGIYSAEWNLDCSILTIITKNNTLISMSNTFDLLQEINIHSICPQSLVSMSWSSDCNTFALLSTDNDDNIRKIHIFTKECELKSIGRNIAEGDAGVLKGLGLVVRISSNGSYITVPQQRQKNKLHITLLERNGLFHGGFELQVIFLYKSSVSY